MAETKSVVTPERFASGFTYEVYLAQVKVNRERFEEFYQTCQLSREDREFFNRVVNMPDGAARVLVLGEAWCPDVLRGMPAVARIAEASGMEMRVFPRDANPDIQNEFLNRGTFQSIPTVVFYTGDQQYLCHWIERPALANQERSSFESEIRENNPGAAEQEIRTQMRERTRARQSAYQQDSIREMRQMLATRLGI